MIPRLRQLAAFASDAIRSVREHRITGVAAEVAFFMLLALPPFLLALAGALGFLAGAIADEVRDQLLAALETLLRPDTFEGTVQPAVERLFDRGRADILGIGILLAAWSSSRMMKRLIEAMNIAYGIAEARPAWRRRLVAVGLTVAALVTLAAFLPVLIVGPRFGEAVAGHFGLAGIFSTVWAVLYWPVVAGAGILILSVVYHLAPNRRTPWRRDLPGAVLAAVVWLTAAGGLRIYVRAAVGEATFGPLAAPVVLLLWLYVTALAILLGAELNGALHRAAHTEAPAAAQAAPAAAAQTAPAEPASSRPDAGSPSAGDPRPEGSSGADVPDQPQ